MIRIAIQTSRYNTNRNPDCFDKNSTAMVKHYSLLILEQDVGKDHKQGNDTSYVTS